MTTTPEDLRARNLRMLGMLAALFLVPLLLAFYMYYGTDWRPVKRVNHGTLISPVRPLPLVNREHGARVAPDANAPPPAPEADTQKLLRDKWSIIYIGAGNCDEP